jgi:hypothetical protein
VSVWPVFSVFAREGDLDSYKLAGIDVHTRRLAVVIANAREAEGQLECRRFGTTTSDLRHLWAWWQERAVQEVVRDRRPHTGSPCGWRSRGIALCLWRKRDPLAVPGAARPISGMPSGPSAAGSPEISF